ncbi:sensor histidine kinase [Prosthecomicrobium pneumaticum]|uniref:histidine kinase n=1 Tax=Prosthecomicrobium pneumaticum TaxID=81895 RepID=A0A7W9FQH4_9HYPH|nr:CHASE3 domain-containing protein [Prosthecomicrobium pneumaticum]MBB5755014.1 hypothetical protein [Prosthecomicrobium pneumaticum]
MSGWLNRPSGPVVLVGLGLVALVMMGVISVLLVRASERAGTAVTETLEVQNQILTLQLTLRRAESGQRGYLLTSDPDYLDTYAAAIDLVMPRLERLRILVSGNAVQAPLVERLGPFVEDKVRELREVVALHQAGRTDDALAVVRSDLGQNLMTSISELAGQIRSNEEAGLVRQNQQAAGTNRLLLFVNLAGAVAIAVLAALSILLIRRFEKQTLEAQAALREANLQLEEKVEERTADLSEANDEIQRFAYIVSHDLRSPLVNIMGFTSELEAIRNDMADRLPPPPQGEIDPSIEEFDEALRFIKSSIRKMDGLINAILNLSRAGRREFDPQWLPLGELVTGLTGAMAHQLLEADARIEVEPLPQVETDRLAIGQIFSNLLDNAVKYLRPGVPGLIRVSAVEKGRFVLIRVEDNGRGIEEKDRERVFELFRRAGPQDRPGEGIGLAHVRTLVRRLGGTIRLESEAGKGSTFTVILPKAWRPREVERTRSTERAA